MPGFKSLRGLLYIIFSFILWIIVEYITVWRTRFEEWMSLMPWAALQYLVIILIFYYFLYWRDWNELRVFGLMVLVMYVFEFLWQNFLLLNIVLFIPTSILLIQIWGFLTFIPYWIVESKLRKNKKMAIFYALWPVLGFVMSIVLS